MNELFSEGKTYEKEDFSLKALPKGDYDQCQFINCHFSGVHLSNYNFIGCDFNECDLSNVRLGGTGLKEVRFVKCKMVGTQFTECNPFLLAIDFEDCQLDFAVFNDLNLPGTSFMKCQLKEVDFSGANLNQVEFQGCDMENTHFENTKLEQADFRWARNFSIDPELNNLRKARFSKHNLSGLLHKYKLDIS
ncbi:MAG: pentapeptide repeat-containing protein [Owenweeksia sp.]|nr:pentapeptide repeat-containing protein [Owenweeksia sp.]